MPAVRTSPPKQAPKKPASPKVAKPEEAKVVHPECKAVIHATGYPAGPITAAMMREWLGWESESEYAARVAKEHPGVKSSKVTFGSAYLLTDMRGEKVRCKNNLRNRPFNAEHSKTLAQELLNRHWAGPTCFPGETINDSAFTFSRTGECHNGQHRGAALIFAVQMWEEDDHWHELWETEPTMDSLVVFGLSDKAEIIRTIDDGQARTEADVFYTEDVFAKLSSKDKRECSLMTQAAVDLLWKRTKAKDQSWTKYKSNTEACLFLKRHPTLLKCIKHCWEENRERAISAYLKTTGGNAAGLMYLMATGKSSGEDYRSAEPRVEDGLDLSLLEKAADFWALAGKSPDLKPLVDAVERLNELNHQGAAVKTALIWKAWNAFRDKDRVEESDLQLEYQLNEKTGKDDLVEFADFGGIDVPDGDAATVTAEDKESIDREADAERMLALAKTKDVNKKAEIKAAPQSKSAKTLADLRRQHPGKVLLFRSKSSDLLRAFGEDCKPVYDVLDVPVQDDEEQGQFVTVPPNRAEHLIGRLLAAKRSVAICEQVGEAVKVADRTTAKK